ncbi:bifunctional arginine demethylase and lysyl-hydroxylase PSR-like [Oncorhynchus clarkii lewisi]|uniref:bifunctional arginine demethylase and lysyl-hydroxylase PSR-like n=1 Tax=Oncorhynchus clarkii lewisi TaxID=490388 RepID=UPI0039B84286
MLVNGNMNTYPLTGLIPNTEYKVPVSSTFRDNFKSDAVNINESTGKTRDNPSPLDSGQGSSESSSEGSSQEGSPTGSHEDTDENQQLLPGKGSVRQLH